MAKLGRKETFATSKAIAKALKTVGTSDQPSTFLLKKLEDKGFVEFKPVKVTEGRGRPKLVAQLTGKGRGFVALSSRWK